MQHDAYCSGGNPRVSIFISSPTVSAWRGAVAANLPPASPNGDYTRMCKRVGSTLANTVGLKDWLEIPQNGWRKLAGLAGASYTGCNQALAGTNQMCNAVLDSTSAQTFESCAQQCSSMAACAQFSFNGAVKILTAVYGGHDFCTETSPCSVGQGDCDNDKDCASGYKCWQRANNGPAAPGVSFTSDQIKGKGDYCYNPGKQHIILANSSCSHVFAAVSVSG